MKSPRWPLILVVLTATILGLLLGGAGWYLWRTFITPSIPTIQRNGGTVLLYEVVDPPAKVSLEETAAKLQRRLQLAHFPHVRVRAVDDKLEIALPRQRDHAGEVERLKTLMARRGSFELRILANEMDDRAAIDAAMDFIGVAQDNEEVKKELDQLRDLGKPPPPPRHEEGEDYPYRHGYCKYAWVELSPMELQSLGLLVDPTTGSARDQETWRQMDSARAKGEAVFLPFRFLVYSWKLPTPRPTGVGMKDVEYFVLTRIPGKNQEITGQHLEEVREDYDRRGRPAIGFKLTSQGGHRMHELTSRNEPGKDGFKRHLAIIIDHQVLSAPTLNAVIGQQGVIEGDFTTSDVHNYVHTMLASSMPVQVKPQPVAETSVKPQ